MHGINKELEIRVLLDISAEPREIENFLHKVNIVLNRVNNLDGKASDLSFSDLREIHLMVIRNMRVFFKKKADSDLLNEENEIQHLKCR